MDSHADLSYAFLEAHPNDAARVLERLSTESASALLEVAPIRIVAPVLRQMLPLAGARCLLLLEDSKAVGLLRAVGAQAGVALLRQFDSTHRTRLLSQLPTTLSITIELLLGYPEGTVGAWMEPNTLALPSNMRVSEALERVKQMEQTSNANPYVINQHLALIGFIELSDLIRADSSLSLQFLAKPCAFRLPAQALLRNLPEHQGWTENSLLPVVDHKERLVGSMSYATLLKGLAIDAQQVNTVKNSESMLGAATSTYWQGISTLIQSFVSLLPVESTEKPS
jgi:magnesium transporter